MAAPIGITATSADSLAAPSSAGGASGGAITKGLSQQTVLLIAAAIFVGAVLYFKSRKGGG